MEENAYLTCFQNLTLLTTLLRRQLQESMVNQSWLQRAVHCVLPHSSNAELWMYVHSVMIDFAFDVAGLAVECVGTM